MTKETRVKIKILLNDIVYEAKVYCKDNKTKDIPLSKLNEFIDGYRIGSKAEETKEFITSCNDRLDRLATSSTDICSITKNDTLSMSIIRVLVRGVKSSLKN